MVPANRAILAINSQTAIAGGRGLAGESIGTASLLPRQRLTPARRLGPGAAECDRGLQRRPGEGEHGAEVLVGQPARRITAAVNVREFALASGLHREAADAQAPSYPCNTVKFVVPYPPGGASDLLARVLVPGLNKQLGTTIVVENKAGASGNIGTGQVSAAPGDGCTLLLATARAWSSTATCTSSRRIP